VITDEDLAGVGTNLYRFMGRCAALMTDYSSIWLDYATLDRPMLLYCPDVSAYTAGRGFAGVPFRQVAPGPIVETAQELHAVLEQVADGVDVGREQRRAACEVLGVEVRFGATGRLMEKVSAHAAGRRDSSGMVVPCR
jgi:CDP-glycerol glycerophosphotransferase